jgi:hypothetical protein
MGPCVIETLGCTRYQQPLRLAATRALKTFFNIHPPS